MSVIVKGMEMPANCRLCYFCDDEARFCKAVKEFIPMVGKPWFCPLVELPEKHGRLIDADDYAAEMMERQANAMLWKEKAARYNDMTTFARGDQAMRTFSEAKLTLDNMETIVEAEGE